MTVIVRWTMTALVCAIVAAAILARVAALYADTTRHYLAAVAGR